MKTSNNFSNLVYLFAFQLFMQSWGGVVSAQTCPNNVLPNGLPNNAGIQSTSIPKKFTIGGNAICPDVALMLRYDPEYPYSGIIALTTPGNFSLYSSITQNPALKGDMVISALESKHIVITTRDAEGKIRFATTPPPPLPPFDIERMTITPDGKVGIGITQPLGILDINVGSAALDSRIIIDNYVIFPSLKLYRKTTPPNSIGWTIDNTTNYGGGLYFKLTEPVNLVNGNLGSGSIKVAFKDDGNVGINVCDLNSRLAIKGAGNTNSTSSLNVTNSSSQSMLFVRDDGFVGINTDTPEQMLNVIGNVQIGSVWYNQTLGEGLNYRLSVDGQVAAKEVVVEIEASNWSDFVFEPGYNLLTLEELDRKIKSLGHLPEIPSAAIVGEKGINLGEMQVKLLKKVEELTLYIIKLNKEKEELISRLTRLENALPLTK